MAPGEQRQGQQQEQQPRILEVAGCAPAHDAAPLSPAFRSHDRDRRGQVALDLGGHGAGLDDARLEHGGSRRLARELDAVAVAQQPERPEPRHSTARGGGAARAAISLVVLSSAAKAEARPR